MSVSETHKSSSGVSCTLGQALTPHEYQAYCRKAGISPTVLKSTDLRTPDVETPNPKQMLKQKLRKKIESARQNRV